MVEGNVLTLCFNDCYSTYTGTLDPDFISGSATNIVGESWTFTMDRLS
jgi:hypothetical protein